MDLIAKLPMSLRLILAVPLSKLSKDSQSELLNDVSLVMTALENKNGDELIRLADKYHVYENMREYFGE